jgi:integrase
MKYTNGSVFPQMRNGKQVWMVEVVIGYNPDGSRRRTRRQAATKSEALRLRAELIAKAYKGELAPKGGESLDSFAIWWLRTIKSKQVRSATAGDYEARYRLHISPIFGKRKIADISSRDIANWIDDLSRSGHSDSSVNGVRQVLSMVMGGAVEHGHIEKNPVKAVRKIRTPYDHESITVRAWSEEECRLALKAVKGTNTELAVTLALLLGLRKSEVLGLKWSDFNFEEGSLKISRSKREVRQFDDNGHSHITVELYPPKNASSARKIGIPPSLATALLTHREAQQQNGHYDKEGWIFTNTAGGPLAPSGLSKRYAAFLKESGLRPIRFHDLRHSAANLALSGNARLESVSQVLGHSNVHTTKSIYAPFVEALNHDFVDAIESQIQTAEPLNKLAGGKLTSRPEGGQS